MPGIIEVCLAKKLYFNDLRYFSGRLPMRDRKGMLTDFLAERMGRPWIEADGRGAGFASRLWNEADRSVRAPFDASLRGFAAFGDEADKSVRAPFDASLLRF
jgi:hypothetical protein